MSESFGSRLRRLREERGIAVATLAPAVGLSQATLRQLETGHIKNPTLMVGLRLADKLNVDPYYLAFGEGSSLSERFDLMERRIKALEQRLQEALSARP